MGDDLWATTCLLDKYDTLIPFGDPPVHRLPNNAWVFDGHTLTQTLHIIADRSGRFQVLFAIGHGPYTNGVGIVECGMLTMQKLDPVSVDVNIHIEFDGPKYAMRSPCELAERKRALPRMMRMLTR